MLRTLAWWWAASNFTSEWLLNLAQIFGVPIRWATYAQGTSKEQIDLIEEMLDNMGSAAWAAFPAGTTLDLKEAVKSGTDNPQMAFLNLFDKIADLLILGQTLTSEMDKSGGSFAAAKVHGGVLSDRKRALINWTVKLLNTQFVPTFCRLNFGDTAECPYFLGGGEEEEDAKTTADTFKVVLDSGAAIPRRHFYDKLGIPEPKAGEPVIEGRSTPAPGLFGGDPAALLQGRGRGAAVQAKSAQEQLADRVLEDLTGVEPQWLGAVKPVFHRLIAAAKSGAVSDAEFVSTLERAQREMPELFGRLGVGDLQSAMENAMGAAVVNGAVRGALKRKAVAA
jgi:phage gp29-like protein